MYSITYLGHAGFLIETDGVRLIFDPFITPNELANKQIDVDSLQADAILLSHGHADHVADAERIARNNSGATIVSNYEIAVWYESKGLKVHPMNHGGKWSFGWGTVKYVAAVHSSQLPDGSYGGNPGGFVVRTPSGSFYFAGDTALTYDMKLIPLTCGRQRFAILPIGSNFTMDYMDAAIAAQFVEVDVVVGCHYDTFGYIKIDHDAAVAHFAEKGIKLILPEIGKPFVI